MAQHHGATGVGTPVQRTPTWSAPAPIALEAAAAPARLDPPQPMVPAVGRPAGAVPVQQALVPPRQAVGAPTADGVGVPAVRDSAVPVLHWGPVLATPAAQPALDHPALDHPALDHPDLGHPDPDHPDPDHPDPGRGAGDPAAPFAPGAQDDAPFSPGAQDDVEPPRRSLPYSWLQFGVLAVVAFVLGFLLMYIAFRASNSPTGAAGAETTQVAIAGGDVTGSAGGRSNPLGPS